jgi:hypothetical protein
MPKLWTGAHSTPGISLGVTPLIVTLQIALKASCLTLVMFSTYWTSRALKSLRACSLFFMRDKVLGWLTCFKVFAPSFELVAAEGLR